MSVNGFWYLSRDTFLIGDTNILGGFYLFSLEISPNFLPHFSLVFVKHHSLLLLIPLPQNFSSHYTSVIFSLQQQHTRRMQLRKHRFMLVHTQA